MCFPCRACRSAGSVQGEKNEEAYSRSRANRRVVTPALALTSGVYYVGLDMTTHTCSVVTKMAPGMKMMGKYKSQKAAEKAMAGMKKCHA